MAGILTSMGAGAVNDVSDLIGNVPIVGGLLRGLSSGMTAHANQKAQKELIKYQQDWQEKMWNMNNEYNTPTNVVQRLKDAGLNANLAYGDLSGNVSKQPSGASIGGVPTLQDDYSKKMELAQYMEQKRVNDSVIDANNAKAEKERADANKIKSDTDKQEAGRPYWKAVAKLEKDILGDKYEILESDATRRKLEDISYKEVINDQRMATHAAAVIEDWNAKHMQQKWDFEQKIALGKLAVDVRRVAAQEKLTHAQITDMKNRLKIAAVEGRIKTLKDIWDIFGVKDMGKLSYGMRVNSKGIPMPYFNVDMNVGALASALGAVVMPNNKAIGANTLDDLLDALLDMDYNY